MKAPIISFSKDMSEKNDELRKYLYQHLYQHNTVEKMNKKGQSTIHSLFKLYKQNTSSLSKSFQKKLTSKNKYRVIADYIAGMTDSYAVSQKQN